MGLLSAAPPDLTGLYSIFGDPIGQIPHARFVSAEETPEPYRTLLAHDEHMTVTMERHHGASLVVDVLKEVREDNWYARKILLRHSETGQVIMFGIMRFNFEWCTAEVREEILEHKTPLGRILIRHNVLRRISTHALMRIRPNPELVRCFGLEEDSANHSDHPPAVYGRLATIFCNEEPAVDLLEVPSPAR